MLKVFIGSSREAEHYAQFVQEILAKENVGTLPWWRQEAFPVNFGFLEALENVAAGTQAAVLIATPEDQLTSRGRHLLTARQNVLLEFGLFTGAQGRANVALVVFGTVELPSDLEGVARLQFEAIGDRDVESFKETQILPGLRAWIQRLKHENERVTDSIQEVTRLARELGPSHAIALLGEALWLRLKDRPVERYPREDILEILRSCSRRRPGHVGFGERTYLEHYIHLSALQEESDELRKVACTMCHRIIEVMEKSHIRPTRVVVPKTGAIELGRRVADLLQFPAVYVALQAPSRNFKVDGAVNPGDEMILVHDVIVSGDTLVKCVNEIRRMGGKLTHVFAFVHYAHPKRDPQELFDLNGLTLHSVETVDEAWFNFLLP